jgi:hypothetical protein
MMNLKKIQLNTFLFNPKEEECRQQEVETNFLFDNLDNELKITVNKE